MQTEIIVFSNKGQPKSEQIGLKPFHCELKKTVEENKYSAVCLIEDEWLIELRKCTDQIEYKGKKHPKKSLTYYFRRNEGKILFVDGCIYRDFSQLKRSIKDFLKKDFHNKNHSLYFLAVSKEFFEKAKGETVLTYSISASKKGPFQNTLLNMVNHKGTKIDLKEMYIGNSELCMLVRQNIAIAAQHDFPVLILGETGTGKEIVARNIHACSKRSNKPFIAVNCSAISSELFESEIFGHVEGAFTNAISDKDGLWIHAGGGTFFLDEIGDLSLNHQSKILRALQENVIKRVGEEVEIPVNARIIAATNKNIEILATDKSDKFREDLYYRINTFIIRTPPLSSHPEDLPELAAKIWKDICREEKFKTDLSDGVLNQLRYMNWPGNVRSVKQFLYRLFAFFKDETITEEHVHVLQQQEMENWLKSPQDNTNKRNPFGDKDFEKAIMKIEYLLKASLYCEDEKNRRELLEKARESLGAIG